MGILILTMHGNEEFFLQGLKLGASGYLPKSALDTEMLEAVRAVADQQVYIHPTVARTLVVDYLSMVRESEVHDPYERLTDREKEIFNLIAEGNTNREIAEALSLSVNTVHNHRTSIMAKLGLYNRMELLKFAVRRGLLCETV